ncbi:MAG: tRNA (N(6)-L-threonylcarbamoyladenosine(37)-C(2))-methylthiotransferase [Methanobacteriota archaeon]|nr:MAG: tRNA (N(6)-L-threonylcarbamoyladenosine(37)-C(2))-methylthiotransferase [Euryarchaeota archaeon]
MRAYVESYGCTLNKGEADEIRRVLASKGWLLTEDHREADLAVIATCIVVESTERRMFRRVKELTHVPRLIITGCLPTGLPEAARAAAPLATFVPPGDVQTFIDLVETVGPSVANAVKPEGYAIVPLAKGCSGDCSYCITRLARGGLKSRSSGQIIDSVSSLSRSGPLEIRLTSQDNAVYGADTGGDLVTLLRDICAVDADFRLRIGMMNPGSALRLGHGLVEAFRDRRVFRFAHLPVQSGSDRLLAEMNRDYSVDDFERVVDRLRSGLPDLTLSTDIIAGYPSETESDHESNLELIRRVRPDIVNVTRFSPRPRTRAASAGPRVVGWMTKERSRELTRLRFELALARNERLVGSRFRALATERGKGLSTILRTDAYKQVVVQRTLPLRRYYDVAITAATPTYLLGERVEDG